VITIAEFKTLVTRLENAVASEAECEYRDLSHVAAKRRGEAVTEARRNLIEAIEKLIGPFTN
jgi:hypothetical protein